jgi:UPF0176 protein
VAVKVAAFYKFVTIDEPSESQEQLRGLCERLAIKGTILVASEGVNGTVSGSEDAVAALCAAFADDARFADMQFKFSMSPEHPFQRLKIKIKPEIVTFGAPHAAPAIRTGTLVEPEHWNALISDPDVVVIDTRNDYEVAVGTFEGARDPKTASFSAFAAYARQTLAEDRKRRIAMFCTGGIRCEKASAFLLAEGFEEVYQLKGGILNYLEKVSPEDSLWRGECFVFDERVALAHGVQQGQHVLCEGCGYPVKGQGSGETLCAGCQSEKSAAIAALP